MFRLHAALLAPTQGDGRTRSFGEAEEIRVYGHIVTNKEERKKK